MSSVYIVSAVRSPIGTFKGQFGAFGVAELAKPVIEAALERSKIPADKLDEVFIGNVLTAGKGQNTARQAALSAGVPKEVPATTINMLCGSGLKAVAMGYSAIKAGDAEYVLCGGVENMTAAEHVVYLRDGVKLGDRSLRDTLLVDGLTDATLSIHMGHTAEEVAKRYNITREEQDDFALKSQMKTKTAVENNHFEKEIVGIYDNKKKCSLSTDEHPRPDSTPDSMKKLRPAFDKNGTVTAGNASGINDGAAMVVLASTAEEPLAKIVGYAQVGLDPHVMGLGPIGAIRKLLQKIDWSIEDVDIFEVNEAFAAQSIAVIRDLALPEEKVNVCGGAIALGHPIGASGTRVLVTLVHNLKRLGKKRGVAALCVGGGMGIAMAVENCST